MAMTLEEITAAVQKLPLNSKSAASGLGSYGDYVFQSVTQSQKNKNLLLYGGGALAVVLLLALVSKR